MLDMSPADNSANKLLFVQAVLQDGTNFDHFALAATGSEAQALIESTVASDREVQFTNTRLIISDVEGSRLTGPARVLNWVDLLRIFPQDS